jgi:eukaryotic-like serine/threonine-protein kinase
VAQTVRSPILMAAVDIAGAEPDLLAAVRDTVQRLLHTEPGARLACVAVMKTNRIGMDELLDADGSSRHVNLLVQLKHWARPVLQAMAPNGPDGRVTFHVLEAPDPAGAIVEFGRKNQVDHIVMGARSSGGLRRYLGSVSSSVSAEADCTVTVVRATARSPDTAA